MINFKSFTLHKPFPRIKKKKLELENIRTKLNLIQIFTRSEHQNSFGSCLLEQKTNLPSGQNGSLSSTTTSTHSLIEQ